ncbi:MAG: nitroreductase/quinone reductase family protein [Solirubrobacteraceae bacterium]
MRSRLTHVDPNRRRSLFSRAYAAFSGTRLGRLISTKLVWKIDPNLLRVTQGRLGMGLVLPTALLETRGAKSGALRRNAVIYFHDEDRVTIIASKAGADKHPAWFHNLRTHPDVTFGGVRMRATVVSDEAERERLWTLADRVFAPYATYRREAAKANRTIPIVQLTVGDPDGVAAPPGVEALLSADSSLSELVEGVRALRYGRPSDGTVAGMLRESRGTCSTKHSFLAQSLSERLPETDPQIVHRVYRLDRARAEELFGQTVAAVIPADGLIDVHRYLTIALNEQRITVDATFAGQLRAGRFSQPLACDQGDDFPAGEDPDNDKRALEEQHCDPALREPFIAALTKRPRTGS